MTIFLSSSPIAMSLALTRLQETVCIVCVERDLAGRVTPCPKTTRCAMHSSRDEFLTDDNVDVSMQVSERSLDWP